jgi:hypothetical protein
VLRPHLRQGLLSHLKLTSPTGRGAGIRSRTFASTTTPGFINPRKQEVIRNTGAPSTTRDAQTIYELRCNVCKHRYGAAGIDIKDRCCPKCQNGAPGEQLREAPRSLFD